MNLSTVVLLLVLGLVNWFATLLIVESEVFREVRDWFDRRLEAARARVWDAYNADYPPTPAVRRADLRRRVWYKLAYLVNCHMCAGTWVGLFMAAFVPALVDVGPAPVAYLLTALAIKALGHLTLVVHKVGEAKA